MGEYSMNVVSVQSKRKIKKVLLFFFTYEYGVKVLSYLNESVKGMALIIEKAHHRGIEKMDTSSISDTKTNKKLNSKASFG
jgi:hypothetical protein